MPRIKKALIIPDVHIPYEDKRAVNLLFKVGRDVKPDEVVLLGDVADNYAVSAYSKDPGISGLIQEEIKQVNSFLDRLDSSFTKANFVFIEGNHEHRLSRFISKKAPELYGMFDMKSLLKVNDRGYRWIPFGPRQKYPILGTSLFAKHAPIGYSSVHCASNTARAAGASVIFGDRHRIQEWQYVTMNDDEHRGICCGWLGDKKNKVMRYMTDPHQWSLGFAVLEVVNKKHWFCHVLPIIDYMCSYGGKIYKS